MADVSELHPDQQLTYAIGSIIRDDNFAEGEAKSVFTALAAPSPAAVLAPRDFARILEGCRDMVRASALPEFPRDLALEVLAVTSKAHQLRNKLTHDRWIHLPTREEAVWLGQNRTKGPGGPVPTSGTLQDFIGCSSALNRAGWRLRALWLILPAWLGNRDALEDIEDSRPWWTSVAMDRFIVSPQLGRVEVELVESPEPPRLGA